MCRALCSATLAVILGLVASPRAVAQSGVADSIAHYRMRVRLDPVGGGMAVEAELGLPTGTNADTVTLLLHGELRVDSARIAGEPAQVRQEPIFYEFDYSLIANQVRIPREGRGPRDRITIWYSGPLHASGARSASDYMRIDGDGVFLRGYGYSPWFPVLGDQGMDPARVSFDRVTVEAPEGFVAVLTGELLGRRVEDGRETSEWRALALEPWNAQLTARPYVVLGDERITVYALDDSASRASGGRILETARAWDAFFRERYGPSHASGHLHVLQMPRFGDIASGNVVGVSREQFVDFDPASFSGRTLAHEMVHAHVQVPVSSSDPLAALVIEGFPSYFHVPAMAGTLGSEFYRDWIERTQRAYLERRRTGLDDRGRRLPPEKPLYGVRADEIGTYKDRFVLNDRAPLFLDWLRRRMGDEGFFAWARELFALPFVDHAGFERLILDRIGTAERTELRAWLETTDYPARWRR